MRKLTIDEFQNELIKMEHKKYATHLATATLEHWSDEAVDIVNRLHYEMMTRLNDDKEIGKMYLQYISENV